MRKSQRAGPYSSKFNTIIYLKEDPFLVAETAHKLLLQVLSLTIRIRTHVAISNETITSTHL